ncbi:MAG: Npt1/Npt2 family nucleotide transporter [Bryobacteraceae bacterium]|nr:Npt1/Npt2 family nucleotide transporter [Bryobacteraceae bacterium]
MFRVLRWLRAYFRNLFDIRKGEYVRTSLMAMYLMFVLFAYYILKPVSQSMFLNKFDVERLPYLYIFVAAAGGVLAYSYTKLAVRASLRTAVNCATIAVLLCLAGFWVLLGPVEEAPRRTWAYYLFSVWVSLFSIVFVSQGWLVAANVFDTREARRVYGLLGLGAVLGAAFGGSFTALFVETFGTKNLLWGSATMVVLAWICFRLTAAQPGVAINRARAAETEAEDFTLADIGGAVKRYRHLQVIIAIITLTYMVDVTVEYQFSAIAKQHYQGDELTAFLGSFRGLWVNLVTFTLQLFLTSFVVSRFGVGGTLQIMPVTLALASAATVVSPGLFTVAAARLSEAAGRYSFNRTGMELLYLPLPTELKNRTKAFVDIFVDRMARGLGGVLLILLTGVLDLGTRAIAAVVIVMTLVWIFLTRRAQREYVQTVRKRLELRRLDLESARLTVNEPETLRLLEQTAHGENPRQATYSLNLLAEAPGYPLENQLRKLVRHPAPDMRARVFELARDRAFGELLPDALAELETDHDAPSVKAAAAYALRVAPDTAQLAATLVNHSNHQAVESALEELANHPELAPGIISRDWIAAAANDWDSRRRCLAAIAIRIRPEDTDSLLRTLADDPDPAVVSSACRTMGFLEKREHLSLLFARLSDSRVRGAAIEALARYGARIHGTLADILGDVEYPLAIRRHIPRVLQRIPAQRSVELILARIGDPDLTIRAAVLRALAKLRSAVPALSYRSEPVARQILDEARYYFSLHMSLAPFQNATSRRTASSLLARTLEERLRNTIERLFTLLGLQYPQKEISAAYQAVNRRQGEEYGAAIDFLEGVLDRELKRVLLPLLDSPTHLAERAEELFGFTPKNEEAALRDLLNSRDEWLAACAAATAAELKMHSLAPDIRAVSKRAGQDLGDVAHSALLALT